MDEHTFTIDDVAKYCKVSSATVRRFIHRLYEEQEEKAKELITKEKIKTGFKYTMGTDFIDYFLIEKDLTKKDEDKPTQEPSQKPTQGIQDTEAHKEHIDSLKRTIDLLERQLEAKDKMINDLNSRLQESNLLHGNLQNKLLGLPDNKLDEVIQGDVKSQNKRQDKSKQGFLSSIFK